MTKTAKTAKTSTGTSTITGVQTKVTLTVETYPASRLRSAGSWYTVRQFDVNPYDFSGVNKSFSRDDQQAAEAQYAAWASELTGSLQ